MAERDELLDHNYDGIQEYDNDLPRWWVAIFWITAAYGVFYVVYLHFGPGLDQHEQLAVDMQALEETRAAAASAKPASTGNAETLLALTKDATAVEQGKTLFAAKCASCHAELGQGLVGPNLTDDHWIHGGTITDIRRVVNDGIIEKGMLAWQGILSDEEINAVSAFVWTLHGSNPPNPKKPEGELVQRP